MKHSGRVMITVGSLFLVLGVLMSVLPKNWIEQGLGIDPDGGSGFVELALSATPLLVGITLLASAFAAKRTGGRRALAARSSGVDKSR